MDFTGKVAVSTGAASGMGLLFSQCFAELGGNVVMCDVNREVLDEKAKEINAKGKGKALAVYCDVRDYENVCQVRETAVETFGAVDIVVNFAGGYARRMLKVDSTLDAIDVPIDVYDWGLDVTTMWQFAV